jgi:predicted esterase
MRTRYRTSPSLLLPIILAVCLVVLIATLVIYNTIAHPFWLWSGKVKDEGAYLVYLPDDIEEGKTYPLVFALSPGADAQSMINTWAGVAEKHHWIIAASKEFRNGIAFDITLNELDRELTDVEQAYPINPKQVIFTGISGGGMGSHAMAKFFPTRVSAVVINTGMMEASFMTSDYPVGKLAVFLASPTDFRYTEMQRDQKFLRALQWKTRWIEFEGGHTMAPQEIYAQAADWLEENLLQK